jgi:hypothetical protein
MRKFISSLNSLFLTLVLLAGALIYTQPSMALSPAVDAWWDPNISPETAADLYCQANPTLGQGLSAIIPREGIVLTDDEWTNVTLRGLGCGGANEHQLTLYGQDYVNGEALIDFSQSGYENVTNKSDVNSAGNPGPRLEGDELWMFDTGIGDSDGKQGHDTTLRINRSFFPTSGPYSIEIHGMGWFVPLTCPNPITYANIGSGPNCPWSAVNRTGQAASFFNVLVEVNPPTGVVETTPLGASGVVGQACSALSGWTLDEDSPSSALTVKVYLQTGPNDDPVLTEVYSTTADGARSDQYTGHGFTVPAEVLNEHVNADNPTGTFVVKAMGIVQNGDPIGDPDGIFLASAQVPVCVDDTAPNTPPTVGPPATGRVAIAALLSIVLIGGIAAGSMTLIKRSHKKTSAK